WRHARRRRGGRLSQSALPVGKPAPVSFVPPTHSQNPGPAGTTVRAGGAAYLDVIIHQSGGFNGPITLTAEGLPPGVHALPTTVRGTHGVLVFWADADAAEWTGAVELFATAKVGNRTRGGEWRPYTRAWSEATIATSRPTRDFVLAVRDGAPFALEFAKERVEVEVGKRSQLKLRLHRHAKDFTNTVTIQPLAPP